MKAFLYPEQAAVLWAASKLKRPVKWQSDRSEGFVSDNQGRDHVTRAELALDDSGRFRACGFPRSPPWRLPHADGLVHLDALYRPAVGPYTTPAIAVNVKVCAPTPFRSAPIAAPAGLKPPT